LIVKLQSKKMEVHIVLSYDLGLKGDYPNLYAWLDKHNAIECGNSLAALAFEVSNNDLETIIDEVKNSLEETVTFEKNDRIYLITKDGTDDKMKGKFLFGNRKRAP